MSETVETKNETTENDGDRDIGQHFGSSTGVPKTLTSSFRTRVGSLNATGNRMTPQMPAFLDTTKHNPAVLKTFLAVGLLLSFITIIMLAVISVDACQDFFSYACGNFKTVHPPSYYGDVVDMYSLMDEANEKKLEDSLSAPVKSKKTLKESAEVKGKYYFTSCANEYFKTALGGHPMIKALTGLGGWYALYNFNNKTWNTNTVLNSAVQKAHYLYGAQPFFKIGVAGDWDTKPKGHDTSEEYVIQFTHAPTSLYSAYQYDGDMKHKNALQKLVYTVVQLLWKDLGFTPPQSNQILANTWSDIWMVESMVANISISSPAGFADVHKPINYMVSNFKGKIDWLGLLQSYFPSTGITGNTVVHLHEEIYLKHINGLVNELPARALNNYIMWRVVYNYISDLGWEYVHANRVFALSKYDGYVSFTGQYKWCIIQMKRSLNYLLSGLYVQEHFAGSSLSLARSTFNYLKQSLRSDIDGLSWMDSSAKAEAKLKLDNLQAKIGYPDWLANEAQFNQYYQQLSIDISDPFQNVVNIQKFKRLEYENQLKAKRVDHTLWPDAMYEANLDLDPGHNTIWIPAGFLQHPLFDPRIPEFMNIASMGRYAGGYQTAMIDYLGCHYDENGYSKDWWAASTLKNFNSQIRDCQNNLYVNSTYCWGSSPTTSCAHQMPHPLTFGQVSWRDISALNMAHKGYLQYIKDNGAENGLPGFQSESIDQTFFISFAQTWCQAADPYVTWYYYYAYYQPIPQLLVNGVMTQMPQFQSAFQCSPNTPMGTVNSGKCQGF